MKTFEEAVKKTSQEADELLVKKHRDYGTKNILNTPFGAEIGILIRLHDKISRLANLLKDNKEPNFESIEDSWMDIRNYGEIGLLVRRKLFELPLNKKRKP
jgi:alpha-mannosidase